MSYCGPESVFKMFYSKADRKNYAQNISHLDHRDFFANSVRLHLSWVGIAAKQENELQIIYQRSYYYTSIKSKLV